MNHANKTGSLTIDYAKGREQKKSLRYRLWRRTHEVLNAINTFVKTPAKNIIDLGSAEGRMLHTIQENYRETRCVGVEYDQELVSYGKKLFQNLSLIQGDIESLGFREDVFDVAIATAVIEHVPDPSKALQEIKRILVPGGLFILTAPDPFWEHLATKVGHLEKEQHHHVMNLSELNNLITKEGFTVIKSEKFMVSPVGMPFEFAFENLLRLCHLNFMMANQLIVARC